ncbi:glycoside hydrolase family 43 protein [Luteimicrobium xylanilyticum]|uniref:Xylan 1,4-beta-xylosidase n=1 Tax=Luteimicrobium xylanilyticum TaxID=1133546 RepID=A0A5P9QER6_9MICO|nr:glycoside hydrolase family 43 protein [Luteimicrobium xylanilyticum]QFU99973.1 Xylan 1,4-beta-xylosidase [Luteimicrobium xylanilyticum]
MPAANPVLPGFFPDPSICRVGDTYYLANSTFEYAPGLPVHASRDLQDWKLVGFAADQDDRFEFDRMADSDGLYAPTIRFHDGLFYVVCTRVGKGIDASFIVTATDPAGPWSEPVWVKGSRGFDPSLFFHDGRVYWCATRAVEDSRYFGECEVWVREIDPATGELLGEETVIWTAANRDGTWCEGPRLFERNGWFYVLTAEGGTFRDHAVVIGRSRSITGPYENCPRNPVLTHRHLGREFPVQNVGHPDFVEGADGSWSAVVLAVRTVDDRHVLGRETFVTDVEWEDDWPVLAAGVGHLDDVRERPVHLDEHPPRLGTDVLTIRGGAGFVKESDDGLVLRSTGEDVTGAGSPAAVLYRLVHLRAGVAVSFDDVDPRARVGLLFRQSGAFSVRLEVGEGRARVLVRRAGDDTEVDAWAVEDGASLTIEADFTPEGLRFRTGADWSAPAAVDVLSSEEAGGFVGTVWGPYVEGTQGVGATFVGRRYGSVDA